MRVPLFESTFKLEVSLPDSIKQKALRAINRHYFGDEECNVYNEKTRKYEGKYDDHPNFPLVQEAHYRVNRSQISEKTVVKVMIQVYSDGSFEVI